MFCRKCGAQMPDDARFCSKCGASIDAGGGGGAAAAGGASAGRTPLAPSGTQELKCPTCGAPIHPVFGEMVITCDYCGGSVTLGGQGWKESNKHTMLALKVGDQAAALQVVRSYLDQGFFHRHFFVEAKMTDAKLSYVPFWVLPASASTTYQYQAVATSVGATVGTIAAGALLGSMLGGGRGGYAVVPIFAGPVVNPTRSATISGEYEYPIVAVKAMSQYQPKDYRFSLNDRSLFDKSQVPSGTPVLNGDVGEDVAQHAARAWVSQLQSEEAHKKHGMISNIQSQVNVSDGELLHVPVWYFQFDHKGSKPVVLIDANAGKVIQTIGE